MDKNEKLKMLQRLDERTLTEKFLIPLHTEGMQCRKVQYEHGTMEYGKDLIYCTTDGYGNSVYTGIQVKAGKITARNKNAVLGQITEAFGEPFRDLSDGKKKRLDEIILITSREFTEGAKESLWRSLESVGLDRATKFVDGSQLVDLLDKYLPSAFWDQYDYFNRYLCKMKSEFETIKDVSAIGQREPIPSDHPYLNRRFHDNLRPPLIFLYETYDLNVLSQMVCFWLCKKTTIVTTKD